jgi:ketosteroid isomerase-like protein
MTQHFDPTAGAAEAQACIDAMTGAFARGDIDGVMAAYEPGAVVLAEPGRPLSGTPALRRMFEDFVALDPKFTFSGEQIFTAGDIALHLNTWRLDGRAPDGSPLSLGGLSAVVLRRQPAGHWRMVIDNPFADALMHR